MLGVIFFLISLLCTHQHLDAATSPPDAQRSYTPPTTTLNHEQSDQFDPSIPFEQVITLGDSCMPKAQVNMYLRNKFPKNSELSKHEYIFELHGYSHLFDWVIIKNLGRFIDCLSNSFEGIGQDFAVNEENLITDKAGISYPHMLPGKHFNHSAEDLSSLPMDKINYLREKTWNALK